MYISRSFAIAPGGGSPFDDTHELMQHGNEGEGVRCLCYTQQARFIERELAPGMRANLWGYNGQSTGPTIEAVEGDRVRFVVTNKLGLPLGQLPGDISIQRPGFSFYFPITTSSLVSIVLSAILYLLGR